ncbi:hypothetical protein SAZ11_40190 [Streptomyces sp. FXJ1.4098]|nr:hypothetical protein [Streptomyces sp. FXJ1.4098]
MHRPQLNGPVDSHRPQRRVRAQGDRPAAVNDALGNCAPASMPTAPPGAPAPRTAPRTAPHQPTMDAPLIVRGAA